MALNGRLFTLIWEHKGHIQWVDHSLWIQFMKHPLFVILEHLIHLIQFVKLNRLSRITLVFLPLKSLSQVHGLSSILCLLFFNNFIPGFLLKLASPVDTFLLLHYLVFHLMCPLFESVCPLLKLSLLPRIEDSLCLLMLLLYLLS